MNLDKLKIQHEFTNGDNYLGSILTHKRKNKDLCQAILKQNIAFWLEIEFYMKNVFYNIASKIK